MKISQTNLNRIPEMDALRGFALFGILLVNVFVFHAPYSYYGEFYGAMEGIQGLTLNIVLATSAGKFMFIFSFLFGYGIQLQRNSRSSNFNMYFALRMLLLLLFGALHILFFWVGDILASYALLGLLIIPFLKLSKKLLLSLGIFFIFFRPIYYLGMILLDFPSVEGIKAASFEDFVSTFQQGTYREILKLRMLEFAAFMPENVVWYIPKSFGLFFVGIYAAQSSFFQVLRTKRKAFGITSTILILISLSWGFLKFDFFQSFDLEQEPHWRPILIAMNVLFETLQGFAYIFGFSILFQHRNWLSDLFAKAGRLALSNYILQSLLCVLIFYGFGLGLYIQLQVTDLVLIAMVIYIVNLIFSHLYFKKWSTGPLEYLWKSKLK